MSWSYWIVDTRTGVKQLPLQPASGSWGRQLNGDKQGRHTFNLSTSKLTRAQWRALTVPLARTLVVSWAGVAWYAGMITARPFDMDSSTLTLEHADIRSIFADRYPFGAGSYAGGTLVCTNRSWRAIVARVVQRGLDGPGGIYSLPIVLPSTSEAENPHSKTYHNYNFTTVYDALADLQKTEGGPDTDFEPRWNANGDLEWLLRVGSPTAPALTGGVVEFNMTAAQKALTGVTVGENSAKQVTGVFGIGQGSEEDMIVGSVGNPEEAATIPARDITESHKTAETEAAAAQFAAASIAVLQHPTNQWDFTIVLGELNGTQVAALRLGATLRLYYKGHMWIEDGWHDLRLVGFTGDMTDRIKVEVQLVRG